MQHRNQLRLAPVFHECTSSSPVPDSGSSNNCFVYVHASISIIIIALQWTLNNPNSLVLVYLINVHISEFVWVIIMGIAMQYS